ncbi:MAG: dehydrogenase [Alphaproteobacteria bacterium]|jgi:phosphoglycerate dehydrogenase-like enzyme|nr:dehydrogenase [Alphaproteobacteria bacterium]MBT4017556.1 dehydrogenase [Alphaproteobacteria bacterium]MBT4966119.1 dehydrogenase [Alphaproteobacteria bacterium]MBT5159421.1 dehydrogenase [Alphaproteobacteria bacterium]MBT5917914.1 dehydrogenase [Alphaproteobacteria bacterium]
MNTFRVALSADFRSEDGSLTFPDFDLAPLYADSNIDVAYIPSRDGRIAAEDVADFDALILLMPTFDGDSIPHNGRLGIVARFGVGYDTVDVGACSKAGIAVAITPDGVRRPVAAAVLTFILALAGKLFVKDSLVRQGPEGFARRVDHMGMGLVGKTLGSIGLGNIGAEVFRLCAPLDMNFIYTDPYVDPAVGTSVNARMVDLETLFRESDFITVNAPYNDETHHLVNAERLAMMKPTAYLINTARGPLVDQKALVNALQNNAIAGAALDVFDPEPPMADDPLLALDNVILTPHALCWTDQCFAGIGASAVAAVLDVKNGQSPSHPVDSAIVDNSQFQGRLKANIKLFSD